MLKLIFIDRFAFEMFDNLCESNDLGRWGVFYNEKLIYKSSDRDSASDFYDSYKRKNNI